MSAMINRRTVLAGTAFTGLAALLAACGSSSSSTASSTNKLEAIKSAGKIRVGLEGTYRPFSFHDSNGTLVGFEKEIADLVAKDLGVTAEFIETGNNHDRGALRLHHLAEVRGLGLRR